MTNAERLRSLAEELAIKEYGGCYPGNIKQRLLCDAIQDTLIETRNEALEEAALACIQAKDWRDCRDRIRSLIVPKGDV